MRSTGALPKSCATSAASGRWPPRAARGPAEAGHAPLDGRLLHLRQRGIDRGALGEGGALAPALALLGHDPDEEQRADPVHAGGGADVLAERDVDADELDAAELHGGGRSHPATVDRSLYDRAFSPGWRNGRRGGLKSRCPKGRAGSSPAPGTHSSQFRGLAELPKRPD